jgi:serine protease AprX
MPRKIKIKVFCAKEKQSELEGLLDIQTSYDAFVVGEATAQQVEEIKTRFPVEDMSSYFNTINLKDRSIDTSRPRVTQSASILEHPSYEDTTEAKTKKIKKGLHHYVVQFNAPVKQEWLNSIKKIGGILCEPFPNSSYVVEMDERTLSKVLKLDYVHWVGHYDPKFRISPHVISRAKTFIKVKDPVRALAKIDTTYTTPTRIDKKEVLAPSKMAPALPYKYSITFFTKKNLQQAKPLLNKSGIKTDTISLDNKNVIVDIRKARKDPTDILSKLSQIHGVKRIDEVKIRKLFNNIATGVMNAGNIGNSLGLTGKGEIIGIADTGLDSGDLSTIHPDFRGRVKDLMSYPINSVYNDSTNNAGANDGPKDEDSGHGTHVAGSVLGNGSSSIAANNDILIRGIAYEAQLVFQAIEQWMDWTDEAKLEWKQQTGKPPPEFGLFGLPTDISEIFNYAYKKGCRIHTNSWGGGKPGEYDDQCKDLDNFIWENKDIVVLFAAGNDGADSNGDGKIDYGSVTSPGTAKNCVTVGASENQRPEWNSMTYGQWWPQDFPSPPISIDPMTDSSTTDVVAFSSRGPTDDGRIKPDIVAPGTFILSTRSRYIAQNHYGWAKFPPNKDYFFDGGTSMATPLTAGAVAAIRQHLRTKINIQKPSAALIKAALIHGANRMRYRYAARKINGLYDMEQGWGLVNVKESLDPSAGKVIYVDHSNNGLRTGQVATFEAQVNSSNVPLKITMVYTDYPGTALINNLNLIVTDPHGKRYHGNVFEEPFDSKFDTSNNVEAVYIENPTTGIYKIEIIGANIIEQSQDFALVYSGQIG